MIKQKYGPCKDCNNSRLLIAGRCKFCYWQYRAKYRADQDKATGKAQEEEKFRQALTAWFNEKIAARPHGCEICGENLHKSMGINPRAIICHILPKRNFPEIATNDDNFFYGCNTCHDKFDNGGASSTRWPELIYRRFRKVEPLIKQENRHHIPDYLTETN